jgi:DNA-binding response OmpR family regulator
MTAQVTILIVDDQPEILSGLQLTLESGGYRVLLAEDGHLALEQLYRETVHLIVADIAMPEMNGYQLYERVRTDPILVRIPFIFLTARALDSDVRYGKMLGADDYLAKPVKPEDLLAVVEGRLRRACDLASVEGKAEHLAQPQQDSSQCQSAADRAEQSTDYIVVGALRIASTQHRAWFAGREIELSAREFRVLELLAQHAEDVLTPQEIVQTSHGFITDETDAGALLRPVIRQLRRRLGYAVGEMGCIENVRSVGYRLVAPEQ